MTSRLALAGFVLALTATGAAAAPPTWRVDKEHSRLQFSSVVNGKAFLGAFRSWDATIRFDPNDLAHSEVDATIDTGSALTNDKDRDALLPDEDWFWTSKFARAEFTARGFQSRGAGQYLASGVLTLRGVQRPVSLPFSLSVQGAVAHVQGEVSLDRLVYGVGQGDFASTDTIPAQVLVRVELTAVRQP
jgi:polyisoprenoid-binding protein YceI